MIKFKEFLRECLLNERYDSLNAYRHSIGLPDEDTIGRTQDAIWLGHIAVEDPKKNQGIQSSVEDEARRRIKIEDDLMTPIEPPRDTDTFVRQGKLNQKILNTLADIESRKPDSKGLYSSTQTVNFKRLQSTMDNIVSDRKAQFPDLAKEQEELTDTDKKLETKEKVLRGVLKQIPSSPPTGTTKIVDYLKNFLGTMYTGTVNDWNKNMDRQEEMPWNSLYGFNQTIVDSGDNSKRTEPYKPNPDFEQTRKFTADPALELPQENEQGIRLGRVDYSRKNK
jgi:hypothetical protein